MTRTPLVLRMVAMGDGVWLCGSGPLYLRRGIATQDLLKCTGGNHITHTADFDSIILAYFFLIA